jgi:hypothetical protein
LNAPIRSGSVALFNLQSSPVSVVTEAGMTFCPWCGVNLKRFYGKRTAELDRPGFSIPLSDGPSLR